MSSAYTYIRVSHEDQRTGFSLPYQEQRARQFWEQDLRPKGVDWGEMLVDVAISASKKPLPCRKEGQRLLSLLKPGDHLIATVFDRVFRNLEDFLHCFQFFKTQKINSHLLDCPFDFNTATGRAMLNIRASFAQWESEIKGERIRAAQSIMRQQGRPLGGKNHYGYLVTGATRQRRLQPDEPERVIIEVIARLREVEGEWDWKNIAPQVAAAADRVYAADRHARRREWTWWACHRGYQAFWKIVQQEGADWIRDPEVKALAIVRLARGNSH
jgi:DNA invertase Pin-like site-specific DNA recombinase